MIHVSPTYRQRFTSTGAFGVILAVCAPLTYALLWSPWATSPASDVVTALMAIIGAILILVGREFYDAAEDAASAKIAAERISAQKVTPR